MVRHVATRSSRTVALLGIFLLNCLPLATCFIGFAPGLHGGLVSVRRGCTRTASAQKRSQFPHLQTLSLRRNQHRQQRSLLRMQLPPSPDSPEESGNGEIDYSVAIRNTGVLVGAAALFGAGIWVQMGPGPGLEFFTGYVLEESLSVDNLFVFLLLFEYFKVPPALQKRVLSWGIIGAIAMRALFISAGVILIKKFRSVLLVFAGILLFSSFKILTGGKDDEEEDLSNNQVVKIAQKIANSTDNYDGDRFFTEVDGVRRATPLFLVLLCVELSDLLFAVDSIPAVFGVTEDPFIVFTSNIFAIAGLRALYQILSKAVSQLEYLDEAVALVLGFIGLKMVGEVAGYELPEIASLAIVLSILGVGVGSSLLLNKGEETKGEGHESD